jgi:hypothetical protein
MTKKVTMTRELENVIRVEGKKFAPPSPAQPAVQPVSTESVWLSDEAVESAVRCLRHFYPDHTQEIALSVLQAASSLLTEPKGKAKTEIPEKAVEAAAEAMWVSSLNSERWDQVDYRLRWVFREDALLVLEAVELNLRNSRK